MLSVVMALCLWKFTNWNDVHSLSRIFFIRILWNLITLFRTMMSSLSLIMVHIAPCFQLQWPFVYENSPFETMSTLLVEYFSAVMALCLWKFTVLNDVRSLSWIVLTRILWNLVTLFSTMMSSSSLIMVYMAPCFKELWHHALRSYCP